MYSGNRRFTSYFFTGLLALIASSGCAQENSQSSLVDPVVISGIRVIDGLGNEPNENQDILINDGKIVAIGASGSLEIPDNASSINGNGLTAMPGLLSKEIPQKIYLHHEMSGMYFLKGIMSIGMPSSLASDA